MRMRQLIPLMIWIASSATVQSANILYIAVVNATSHDIWNTALAVGLAERGHNVTFIATRNVTTPHPNIHYHFYEQPTEALADWNDFLEASLVASAPTKIYDYSQSAIVECDHLFKNPIFQNLVDPRYSGAFDVVLAEHSYLDCLLPFGARFNAPFILVSPVLQNPQWMFRLLGVPLFHAHPHVADNKRTPLSLWDRLHTLGICLYDDFNYFMRIRPAMEELNRRHFGDDVLSIPQLAETIAVSLINIPPWMNKVPLTANVIPVGGLHLRKPKTLEPVVKTFLDEAKRGAIYLSFGSLVLTENVKDKTLQDMLSAISKLPFRVLWKWDPSKDLRNFTIPQNVLRLPWVKQRDVLGHPNLRLFISHCGGQSSLEAVYHGVPVLAIPMFWDQRGNADGFVDAKAAIRIDIKDVTEANFFQAIMELTENKRFVQGAQSLQAILRDQPVQPLDLAVFWTEFVARHKGAPHLRPLLWDLPYPQALLLDIGIATLLAVGILVVPLYVLFYLFKLWKRRFYNGSPVVKNKHE